MLQGAPNLLFFLLKSLLTSAAKAAAGLRNLYTGDQPGQIPGLFPYPIYWWEAGAAMNAFIDYRRLTNDTQYDSIVSNGMVWQAGADRDFMPSNQTLSLGNDDQAFWGLAAMTAAESKFPDPPSNQPQWLALAQAVFNGQSQRWDPNSCNGGLRWQVFQFNNGYDYKNAISNGCLFQLAARLAVYTGNDTYAQWAIKIWDWVQAVGFIDKNWNIIDGAHTPTCAPFNRIQWTYNNGVFLAGAAFMYHYTNGATQWGTAVESLLDSAIRLFFAKNGTVQETACETVRTCNDDQVSFKGYLSRWMAYTTQMAPQTSEKIFSILASSAIAAGKSCTGGASGEACGMDWTIGTFDGKTGVGEQLSALETIQANLIKYAQFPATAKSGGTSKGDSKAGTIPTSGLGSSISNRPVTTKDKAGGIILTAVSGILMFDSMRSLVTPMSKAV
ncbi:Mannan endo-1,6-alpha-mannosidase DCW1 [Neolecta irregularis DAH-3]|uniref:Mannan endo-1,6-alpha-mannosidase n=1 Tax=Neolecta irregularis (strain DAH-3) TaxID=1198029 RepID=A0A1U7LN22_NEOID|nr:Mannan endo-1,6-alpha-mannosidase DCW1 [Neolecta irregularis DAH-3]|eukprot:OLL24066.1 Mannan endo-1,6-alpha-mannosidase DCW1 [Neolecta irregularis DAH-3]